MSIVLGIETTCDETSASVVRNGIDILSNVVLSQVNIHKKYGGVFPEIASRNHLNDILGVIKKSLELANITEEELDIIAVAHRPGLIGPLLIGLNTAKTLAYSLGKPLVGVDHIEAHIYASMMHGNKLDVPLPGIGLVVSGGHTSIILVEKVTSYKHISYTLDDAVGETFDKVARLLDLPYPGGPQLEKIAMHGDNKKYKFQRPHVKKNPLLFSFSGLKTQVLYAVKGQNANSKSNTIIDKTEIPHIASSFQDTAFSYLIDKTLEIMKIHKTKSLFVGGGVSSNNRLRQLFNELAADDINIFLPPPGLSTDNGAMIAGLGYHIFHEHGPSSILDITPYTQTS